MSMKPRVERLNKKLFSAILVVATASGVASCATRPVARPSGPGGSSASGVNADPVSGAGGHALSLVVADAINGLENESENDREKLLKEAREYVRYRTGRMTLQEKSLRKTRCRSGKIDSVLCEDILGELGGRPERARNRMKGKSTASAAAIAQAIRMGDLGLLMAANEAEILGALKRIRSPEALERTIAAVEGESGCLPSPMLSALGLRMEQYLPEKRYKDLVISFYSRADRCGGDDFSTLRAQYRLSLLQISEGNCSAAEPILKKVSESLEGQDFRARSYYWRHRCAVQMDEDDLETAMRAKLLEEFPFSLHALLLSPSEGPSHASGADGRDPEVAFRSRLQPDLNRIIRAIEAVQTEGGSAASFRLIENVLEKMGKAEPAFQLYVAVLLRRSGDVIPKFQLLSGLLKRHPELSSKTSLEMLYPIQQFELVRSHVTETDPYLVLSLIRQESAFNSKARSPAGAMGLMQLMPGTARRMERVNRSQLLDPQTNVRLGVRFFSGLISRYSGDVELALAAYNAGPLRADDWVKRYPFTDRLLFVDMIPFKETREYVASIARNYYWYLKLYEQQSPGNRSGEKITGSFALFRDVED